MGSPDAPRIAADELLDPAAIEDPYPLFARLRAECPVAEVEGTGVWAVSSWALVQEAVLRDDDFSANLTGLLYTDAHGAASIFDLGEVAESAGAVIATADEPHHAVHRAVVQPGLVAPAIAAQEPAIRGWTGERTQALVDDRGGDYAARVAEPIPIMATAQILGLPLADCDRLLPWGMTGGDMLAGTTTPERMAALGAQTGEMAGYLAEKITTAPTGEGTSGDVPGAPDLIGALARALHAGTLDLGVAVGIAVTLIGAGGESTASLIGSAVRLLAERPALQKELRAHPERIPRFVEEALRLESPFRFHYRAVKRACTLSGVALAPGDRLMLGWASANRDEAEFERAAEIDLERRFPKRHLGFGRGTHFCVGAHLARLEARVAIEELLARSSAFALDPARPPRHVPSFFVRRLEHLYLTIAGPA